MGRHTRSTYARDRLGAALGLSPPEIEHLALPETCGDHLCAWRTRGQAFVLVRDADGFAGAYEPNAIVIARASPAPDFAGRCRPRFLIDSRSLEREGGGMITPTRNGLALTRAWPLGLLRAWTQPQTGAEPGQE